MVTPTEQGLQMAKDRVKRKVAVAPLSKELLREKDPQPRRKAAEN